MKVNLDYQQAIEFYKKDISNVKARIFEQRKVVINKSAKVVKAAIIKNLNRSDITDPSYKHMQEDVEISIKDDNEGEIIGILRGGKKTGYKWHMLDNGTSNTKAIHFTDKSMRDVESDLDAIINQAIWEAIQ